MVRVAEGGPHNYYRVLADDNLLEVQADTSYYYTHLGFVPWPTAVTSSRPSMYCNRTATGLVRTSTQWTKRRRQIIEKRINKPNFRTHKDGLERVQANS